MDVSTKPSQRLMADLLASVVVFLVALPLCMGIAIASGMPPALGLVTGIIGGIVVGLVQGAPLQVSGPAAGLAVIVAEMARQHGLATLAAAIFLAGLIQIVAGTARGGRWFRAVPPAVVHGMLAGIGILIISSQIHVMVDDRPRPSGLDNLLSIPTAIWNGIVPSSNLPHNEAALVGLLSVAGLLLWPRLAPRRLRIVPAPLVGVTLATAVANLFDFPIAHVQVPDNLWAATRLPEASDLALLKQPLVWAEALALALIASAETLLCAGALERMQTGPRIDYNRELAAQGLGNALCGLLGALPMTGVIVRSSANLQAGARTRLSAILHGIWMLALVALLPDVLRLVPISGLAAILVYTGFKLVDVAQVRQLARYGRSEVFIYGITVVGIVAVDLLTGVLVGLACATAKLLYRLARLEIRIEDQPPRGTTVLHLKGSATFLRLPDVAEALERIPPERELHLRFDELDHVDHAALELINICVQRHRDRGGSVVLDWRRLNQCSDAQKPLEWPAA